MAKGQLASDHAAASGGQRPTAGQWQLTRRQRLLQLIGLVGILDLQGVEVLGAAQLELGVVLGLEDADVCRR